jgi:hypothetical protein
VGSYSSEPEADHIHRCHSQICEDCQKSRVLAIVVPMTLALWLVDGMRGDRGTDHLVLVLQDQLRTSNHVCSRNIPLSRDPELKARNALKSMFDASAGS